MKRYLTAMLTLALLVVCLLPLFGASAQEKAVSAAGETLVYLMRSTEDADLNRAVITTASGRRASFAVPTGYEVTRVRRTPRGFLHPWATTQVWYCDGSSATLREYCDCSARAESDCALSADGDDDDTDDDDADDDD